MIEKIDMSKYYVLKNDDVLQILDNNEIQSLGDIATKIGGIRKQNGKKPFNSYLVLNLDDEIDVGYLRMVWMCMNKLTVRKIAVDMVNAILRSKGVTKD